MQLKIRPVTALQQKNTWPTPLKMTRKGLGKALSIDKDQSIVITPKVLRKINDGYNIETANNLV